MRNAISDFERKNFARKSHRSLIFHGFFVCHSAHDVALFSDGRGKSPFCKGKVIGFIQKGFAPCCARMMPQGLRNFRILCILRQCIAVYGNVLDKLAEAQLEFKMILKPHIICDRAP